MSGHTQTEPVSVHQTRTIIPTTGKFKFIRSCAVSSAESTTMTVTFDCLRGYPASKSALQMLHSPSQCNITSSALFQMSDLDKNSLSISDSVSVCVCECVWSHTYACLRPFSCVSGIVSLKYAKLLLVGFISRVLAEPQTVVCLTDCLHICLKPPDPICCLVIVSFPPYLPPLTSDVCLCG